jgi:hypothetical protein
MPNKMYQQIDSGGGEAVTNFSRKITEFFMTLCTLFIFSALSFGLSSIYFSRPTEINVIVYWLFMLHIPTLTLIVLFFVRLLVILTSEVYFRTCVLQALLQNIVDNCGKAKIRVDEQHVVTEERIASIAKFHTAFFAFTIITMICSIASMSTRAIEYSLHSLDTSTITNDRASFLLIFVDAFIFVMSLIMLLFLAIGPTRYQGQNMTVYNASAEAFVSNYTMLKFE